MGGRGCAEGDMLRWCLGRWGASGLIKEKPGMEAV